MELYRSEPYPCPYLDGKSAVIDYTPVKALSPISYQELLALNFRRNGSIVYRPACPDCQLCRQLRVDSSSFAPNAEQRRSLRRNADLELRIASQLVSDEARDLYARYVQKRHGQAQPEPDDLNTFIAAGTIGGFTMEYRLQGRLVGLGVIDQVGDGLSSVYFAFDPDESRRSLGVYSLCREIALVRDLGLRWLYLGYHVNGARTMAYKARYRPSQILAPATGEWSEVRDSTVSS